MVTPLHYKAQLDKKILSWSLIGDVLHSLTARAKNAAESEHKYEHSKPKYAQEYKLKKQTYWQMRTQILKNSGLFPKEVHYVKRYRDGLLICKDKCYAYQEYLERLRASEDPLFCPPPCSPECQKKKNQKEYLRTDYFLFYSVGEHQFHTVSSQKEAEIYKKLPRNELSEVFFDGADHNTLLPVPFCRKVYEFFTANDENIF